MFKPTKLGAISVSGELFERLERNYGRLEQEYFQPPNVFTSEMHKEWPGDLEGRIILTLVLLAQATGREPKHLDAILKELPTHFNERGYLGVIHPDALFDDQQFAGHGWVLRGLCEYYAWRNDPAILDMISSIVNNLFLPATDCCASYPGKPDERVAEDIRVAGRLTGHVHGNWLTSSDVGSAFIALDGLAHVYEMFPEPRLERLLRNMIEKFVTIDFIGIRAQAHATLSGLRGMLRFSRAVNEPDIQSHVERLFNLYLNEAITENYANYGWFRRPEFTEPCAIVDSFMLSVELWNQTRLLRYLEYAHHILFNALGYAQRPNGGYGPDECAGAKDEFLRPTDHSFEAPWCCSMRGGAGLARTASYSYFQEENHVVVPFYNNNTARLAFPDGEIQWQQTTEYPIDGHVRFKVLQSSTASLKQLSLYYPSWADNDAIALHINGRPASAHLKEGFVTFSTRLNQGDIIELEFKVHLLQRPTINPNNIKEHGSLRHGPLVLGVKHPPSKMPAHIDSVCYLGNGRYAIKDTNSVLEPLNDLFRMDDEQARKDKRQILFSM